MQQLSFFDNSTNDLTLLNKPILKKKYLNRNIIDIKTKKYVFHETFTINKIKALNSIQSKTFKTFLDLGMYLNELRINKPYIEKENHNSPYNLVYFWEYIKDYNIDIDNALSYIRSFEIVELIKENGFKILPNTREQTFLLESYSDSQIIEIWTILTNKHKKPTDLILKDVINSIDKSKLERIEIVNSTLSYKNYELHWSIVERVDLYKKISKNQDEIAALKYHIECLRSELESKFFKDVSVNSSISDNELYLQILNLKSDFTEKELKDSYNALAKIYHPDKNIKESEERRTFFEHHFKLITNAYKQLESIV